MMNAKKPTIKVGILSISDTRTPSTSNIDLFDSSGNSLIKLINESNVIESAYVVEYDCVTDDFDKIQAKMIEWCSQRKVDVLLSIGGIGLNSRDITPEATLGLVQKLTPGISQAIINESLKLTSVAMLSRAVSGICEKTLIINLPGSTEASTQCLFVVAGVIPHAVSSIKDGRETSEQLNVTSNNESRVPNGNTSIHSIIKADNTKLDVLNSNFLCYAWVLWRENKQCADILLRDMPQPLMLSQLSNINHLTFTEWLTKIAYRHRESQFPKITMKSALDILKEHAVLQYTDNNKIKYPTVSIFSTGDELDIIKNPRFGHHIRDTNSVMIKHILEQDKYMGQIFNCGIIRDNWDDLCKRFEEAFNNADIIVTSGGTWMGENDLIKYVLTEHFKGQIHFGRVNVKPGMSTTFVTLVFKDKKKYLFCLPGNPAAAGVSTHLFLLPYLRIVSGKKTLFHLFKAKLKHSIKNLDIRPEYRRALLKYENGELYVSILTNYQSSSRLTSFLGSNCLLQLPPSSIGPKVKSNTIMDVILIKSIENTYISPILKEMNLCMEVFKKQAIPYNTPIDQPLPHIYTCIDDVLHLMTENIFIFKTEIVPTESAMGYSLYSQINACENVPPFDVSSRDGYAIKFGSFWYQKSKIFSVVDVSLPNSNPDSLKEIREGECTRVSTGSPLPPGATSVVLLEDTSVETKSSDGKVELSIAILKEPDLIVNIRCMGTDAAKKLRLLKEKTVLGPYEIGLLRSVGWIHVEVYKCPSVHIVPCNDNSAYAISHKLKNMLELDGFKGSIFTYALCKNLTEIPKIFKSIFGYDDVIIICGNVNEFCNVESHTHISSDTRKISFGFGKMCDDDKKIVFLHIKNCDLESIYNCVHLFILPFLRFTSGRKQIISSIKTKSNITTDYLPREKFEKAELHYENRDFNATCFTTSHQSCLVSMPSPSDEIRLKGKTNPVLDAIVTENSDSYFINY